MVSVTFEQISEMFDFAMKLLGITLGIFWYNDLDTIISLFTLVPAIINSGA